MRPAGSHLSIENIDFLLSSKEATAASGSGENRQELELHVAECEKCRALLQMHQAAQNSLLKLKNVGPLSRRKDCPEETIWPELAASLLSPAEMERYSKHAATCDYCGKQLHEALTDYLEPLSVEENALINQAQVSRPAWQKEMSRKMAVKASGTLQLAVVRKKAIPYRWAFTAALILATAGLSALWWLVANRNSKPPEDLLAEAYKDRRTLELRLGAARYARVQQGRGANMKSFMDRPQALIEAEGIITRGLKSHPDNAAWLQAKGRADLLAWNYDPAIKSLMRALEINPNSSDLQTDLATAYFERAETTGQNFDYGMALELLGKALASQPDNVTALFNRAVIAERMRLYDRAVIDWEHYLRLEHDPEWAAEGREHLANLQKKKVNMR